MRSYFILHLELVTYEVFDRTVALNRKVFINKYRIQLIC